MKYVFVLSYDFVAFSTDNTIEYDFHGLLTKKFRIDSEKYTFSPNEFQDELPPPINAKNAEIIIKS